MASSDPNPTDATVQTADAPAPAQEKLENPVAEVSPPTPAPERSEAIGSPGSETTPDTPPLSPPPAVPAVATTTEAASPPETAAPSPGPTAPTPPATPPEQRPIRPPQPVPQVPPVPQPHDLSRIAQDLQIRKAQVEAVVQLLDEENTVPFITRYRKERTGGLNEDTIRRIQERVAQLRELAHRKQTILRSIALQGRLTDDLTQAILAAETSKRIEDLYLPFKQKKKSLATEAREKGLGPLAEAIWNRDPAVANLNEVLPGLVDPDKWLLNTDDVLTGVKHILAEMVSDSADVRGPLRNFTWDTGFLVASRIETLPEGKGKEYEPYFNFRELVKEIPPHRILAINRGEKANVLRVRVDTNVAMANEIAQYHLNIADHPHRDLLVGVIADSLERLLLPSLEREVRRELTERAQDHAVLVFAKNLKSLLLQPPLRGKRVLAIDPGIRSGCKLAALDETGKLLEDAVIYPHGQRKNVTEAKRRMEQLIRKHQLPVIAIGNGTGCRETEQLVAELIAELEQRRLNPSPQPAPAAPPEPDAGAVTKPGTAGPPPEAARPVLPELPTPATPSFVSDHLPTPSETETITSSVTITPAPIEVVTAIAPEEPVRAPVAAPPEIVAPTPDGVSTPVIAASVPPPPVPTAPAPPPPPVISLEGLPEAPAELAYVIVIEAGASDYSTSATAKEEFPELDPYTRGTISIGRRLQDPLAELVKIDPQHIGVGLYQHDVKQKQLKESLEAVISSCVNTVGVDLNTASVPLLRHVSGLNQHVAREIVTFREKNGRFTSRAQLLGVPGVGEKRYIQAAGFLKIADGTEPLDSTWIHPESYDLARRILGDLGFSPDDLRDKSKLNDLRAKLETLDAAALAAQLGAGEPTVRDILDALARPGRDPREDLPPPIFKKGVLKIEDISPGMELKGTVLNVVPFGAFVDIGLKESGLVHISQMANRYIKSPYDVVSVGDVVTVWVIDVKSADKKISLSMIPPGQERRSGQPTGRGAGEARGDRGRGPAGPSATPASVSRGERPLGQARGSQPIGSERFPRRSGAGGPAARGPASSPAKPASVSTSPNTPQSSNTPPSSTPAAAPAAAAAPTTASPPPPPPTPRPKPQAKPKPLPKLSAEKRSGKAALNTFAELAAFFKQDEQKESEPEPEPPPTPRRKEQKSASEKPTEPEPPPAE